MSTTRVSLGRKDGGIGEYPDPLDERNLVVDVEIPDGWYRVWTGAIKPGDFSVNCVLLQDGITHWQPISERHLSEKPGEPYTEARWYGCLIRYGVAVDKGCDRCGCNRRSGKARFCLMCREIVVSDR